MGPNEPYWQTNTSFSPPPSRWDLRLQPEGLSFGSHESTQQYGSSMSSTSRGSRRWLRSNQIFNQQYSTSEGAGPYFSSPSEFSQQWTPPAIQEIKVDDYGTSSTKVLGPLSLSPSMEGTSEIQDSRSSISTRSDNSDNEQQPIHKSNFPSRRYFMHKPIHPLSFSSHTPTREAYTSSSFTNYSKSQETDFKTDRCGLCERFLSQRSPWSSRRIVKCCDMPIAGILSCRHVFHAECLDQTTPKTHKNDPPCPICLRSEEQHSQEVAVCPKVKNGFLKMKTFSEEGPSRPWGCVQAGDCVEGALHAPPRNTMLLNRNRVRKNLSLKGKEYPGKSRKIVSH